MPNGVTQAIASCNTSGAAPPAPWRNGRRARGRGRPSTSAPRAAKRRRTRRARKRNHPPRRPG
eukprot:7272929-Lingulodinium_polyedra.AAC.1